MRGSSSTSSSSRGAAYGWRRSFTKLRNESSVSATTKARGLGHFDLDLLQKGAATYKGLGLIRSDIDVSKVVRSELIPAK